ncbi:thyroglobulin-like [Epargyreus clarus]|uniref:thyroglobulin-like n=1 Tax=Epargyreus clarus TaxID=520877 RepID=UPI003C2E5662
MSLEANSQCTIAQTCITDLSQADCREGEVLVSNSSIHGCCPSCQPSSGKPQGIDDETCKPPANCLPDGRYAPVQCKGDLFTGRCFCSDENGRRIFGQMWRSEATEMTCACSRRRHEMEAAGNTLVTLHCATNGNYEPLQCNNGMCWCAQPRTGQPTIAPVPEEDMNLLPCYRTTIIGNQYLRKCESVVHAMALLHKEQSDHGTRFLGNPVTFCDYDGSYGPFQIINGIAYCTDRAGEILGSWQVMASEMGRMNCNCARDTNMYFPERGMTVTELCLANGNYQPNQKAGDVYYCVDTDGYPIELLDAWPEDNCASHA